MSFYKLNYLRMKNCKLFWPFPSAIGVAAMQAKLRQARCRRLAHDWLTLREKWRCIVNVSTINDNDHDPLIKVVMVIVTSQSQQTIFRCNYRSKSQ